MNMIKDCYDPACMRQQELCDRGWCPIIYNIYINIHVSYFRGEVCRYKFEVN